MIDDDPSIVRFLEIYLEGQGFRIHSALGGAAGLESARRLLPDIILLDYAMPHVDGAEVLRRLAEDERTSAIPVVVLVAGRAAEEKVKDLDLGVDDYVTKPFDIQELKSRLMSVLSRRREHAQATEAEKIKTLREVAASVSHEVNNPLAAILMCAETLERRHGGEPGVVEKSRMIQQNALRIRDIVKRLEKAKVPASRPYVSGERILDLGEEEEEL